MKEKLKRILNGTFSTFLYLFAWEMFEELVEEGIAFGITTILTKTVSIVFVVSLAQGAKITIKKIIKTITYKEGKDKMKLLKNYFILIWGNKVTGTIAGILGAGLVWYQTAVPQLAGIYWIAVIAFVVCYNIAAFLGGEYFYEILDRIAKANLKKEEYVKIKAAEAKAREIADEAEKIYNETKKAEIEKIRAELLIKQQQ